VSFGCGLAFTLVYMLAIGAGVLGSRLR
jgi:hypothetical protein